MRSHRRSRTDTSLLIPTTYTTPKGRSSGMFSWLPNKILRTPRSLLKSTFKHRNIVAICTGADGYNDTVKKGTRRSSSSDATVTVSLSQGSRYSSYSSEREEGGDNDNRDNLSTISYSSMEVDDDDDDEEEAKVSEQEQRDDIATHEETESMMSPRKDDGRILGNFELMGTLGKGMSGKVKLAKNLINGEKVALKIIYKPKLTKRAWHQLQMEIMSLKNLRHRHILELKQIYREIIYTEKNGERIPSVVLAMELARGGEIFDLCVYTGCFDERLSRTLFRQLASALEYCHSKGVYHRDIKPENLLLDHNYQLKIADFGLSTIRSDLNEFLQTECGTRSYMAPEVLLREHYDGSKADVWCMAIVLFIFLAGSPPLQIAMKGDWWFDCLSSGRTDRFWKAHTKYNPNFPKSVIPFFNKVLQPNPQSRPSSMEVMTDEWVGGPCLTPRQLFKEMARRRAEMKKAKAIEKEEAIQKAIKGEGQGHERSQSQSFDPFADEGHRHRSIDYINDVRATSSDDNLATKCLPRSTPRNKCRSTAPRLGEGLSSIKGNSYFFSHLPALTLLDRLIWAITSSLGGELESGTTRDHIRFCIPFVGGKTKMRMEMKIWSLSTQATQDGQAVILHVVEAQRQKGACPIIFCRLFEKIKTKVEGGAINSFPGPMKEATKQKEDEEKEEEELLTGIIEML